MSYKSFRQLSGEQRFYSKRAIRRFYEASVLLEQLESTPFSQKYCDLYEKWLEKNNQALDDFERSTNLVKQFIKEVDRFEKRRHN